MDKQKVLLVDDVELNIDLLNDVLEDDYDVFFATCGADALITASEEHPDLILLDVMMPEMTGYEVCTTLKADPQLQAIPIVFISALNSSVDKAKGLACGAIDYIGKPFNVATIRSCVKQYISDRV